MLSKLKESNVAYASAGRRYDYVSVLTIDQRYPIVETSNESETEIPDGTLPDLTD